MSETEDGLLSPIVMCCRMAVCCVTNQVSGFKFGLVGDGPVTLAFSISIPHGPVAHSVPSCNPERTEVHILPLRLLAASTVSCEWTLINSPTGDRSLESLWLALPPSFHAPCPRLSLIQYRWPVPTLVSALSGAHLAFVAPSG